MEIVRKHFIVLANASAVSGTLYTPESDETFLVFGYVNGDAQSQAEEGGTPLLKITWSDPYAGSPVGANFGQDAIINNTVQSGDPNGVRGGRAAAGTPVNFTTVQSEVTLEYDIIVIRFK